MNSKNSTSRSTSESSTMKGETPMYRKAKNYHAVVKHGFIYSFGYIMCWRGKVWYTYGRITGTTLDEYISIPF